MTRQRRRLGKFHWREGVFSSEVEEALSPVYAVKYRRWLSGRVQRGLVVVNVACWLLAVVGALDLPWNLGFGNSLFSWWMLAALIGYVLLRISTRTLADAPDELIDEHLQSLRNRAYRTAYLWIGFVLPPYLGFAFAVISDLDGQVGFGEWGFFVVLLGFIVEGLPSMVLAWRRTLQEA